MKVANQDFTIRQLMELDACTSCRACADICPAVQASLDGELSGVHRLKWLRGALKSRGGFLSRLLGRTPSQEEWEKFSETVYRCTLCGNCQEVCPSGIHLKELWLTLRSELYHADHYPAKLDAIAENLGDEHNVFGEDNEERTEWVDDLDDPPDHEYQKENAETVYFTGCVASFFPLAQKVPLALSQVLDRAQVDFTLLGEEEWCCGFPLLGGGLFEKAKEIIEHNVEAVKEKGAKEVVFACPSCYVMWLEHYPKEFRLYHASQYMNKLINEKRLPLEELKMKVTYHDPCDLGRGAREFEAPRQVINALPGVDLVEMADNRENCLCCGGGGNLEMIDKDLSAGIAKRKIDQALATGAEAVVTGCQQCVRSMATFVRRNKVDLKVMDLTQLVEMALVEADEDDD
ncbi:(Fe-S)-binding protein [Dethiosulfatarculus sandiegensis]|uniref:Fe-S oxidoreductase n=1 Tax=Dethiosulfatarculus sandiegensis TaxID=1429043 RepID=A0A0D2HX29_9BACT|nr:(Fe-S)-binding protein [Dethiosulfatarculus sandiegensis]KIX14923.1 Fe-S oxidoreductase [Dethiosulfatarculus sandiegensis]